MQQDNVAGMKISAVMPVHSEKESVSDIAEGLVQLLGDELYEIILIVSPGSPQETFDICTGLSKKYSFVQLSVQDENPGVGRAYRQGLAIAKGSHMLMIDSDGEMPVSTVGLMVKKMKATGCDMVIGSRWAAGGGVKGYDNLKYVLNRGFQFIFRVLLRTKIHDLTLGFKLMTSEIAHSLAWEAIHTNFGAESSMLPIKMGYHVEEVPTIWERRSSGVSKNNFKRNFLYVTTALRILTTSRKALRKA